VVISFVRLMSPGQGCYISELQLLARP